MFDDSLVAHVVFTTFRAAVAGQSTVATPATAATRSYRALVSGSLQPGAPALVGAGIYTVTLANNVADADCECTVTAGNSAAVAVGNASDAIIATVRSLGPNLFEIRLFGATAAGVVTVPIDTAGVGPASPIVVRATFRRISPA